MFRMPAASLRRRAAAPRQDSHHPLHKQTSSAASSSTTTYTSSLSCIYPSHPGDRSDDRLSTHHSSGCSQYICWVRLDVVVSQDLLRTVDAVD